MFIQGPPGSGTLSNPIGLTLSGTPFDFNRDLGFDISPGVDALVSNSPATGFGYVSPSNDTSNILYRLDLTTGALKFSGCLPFSTEGLIAWRPELDGVFIDGLE
jgi:hypothetical protein